MSLVVMKSLLKCFLMMMIMKTIFFVGWSGEEGEPRLQNVVHWGDWWALDCYKRARLNDELLIGSSILETFSQCLDVCFCPECWKEYFHMQCKWIFNFMCETWRVINWYAVLMQMNVPIVKRKFQLSSEIERLLCFWNTGDLPLLKEWD